MILLHYSYVAKVVVHQGSEHANPFVNNFMGHLLIQSESKLV